MRTMFDPATHAEVRARILQLGPDTARRWGRMSAPQMIAHLSDQMRHALGDATAAAQPGLLRNPLVRYVVIYWLPWPRGRITGPPDAFVTRPTFWDSDIATLIGLLDRFVALGAERVWPEHAMLGAMTGRDWGAFCYKHFDHHLRQFGV